ncbi:hypothetical protein PDE_05589 [Penicillium oxalicum 114-2]|uniref:Uncharacterized protein n=1 Tax=Penicillium oxalicum (strain 114-2 / CGMCC 5302) TaxID=933388 RepID=S8B7D8_PENO1|nr:hypothetical protein PDE_05589 [Penicillium oxalicum 114-2]
MVIVESSNTVSITLLSAAKVLTHFSRFVCVKVDYKKLAAKMNIQVNSATTRYSKIRKKLLQSDEMPRDKGDHGGSVGSSVSPSSPSTSTLPRHCGGRPHKDQALKPKLQVNTLANEDDQDNEEMSVAMKAIFEELEPIECEART